MDPQLEPRVPAPSQSQGLDAIAKGLGVPEILRGDAGEPFAKDVGRRNGHPKGYGGQERQLVRRINAFHIKGGIGFGVAQGLRFLQNVFERAACAGHFRENKVRRAVDDARKPLDSVSCQALPERLNNRDPAGHGRFKGQGQSLCRRRSKQRIAMLGQERLIRRNDSLAFGEGELNEGFGIGRAAHELHDHIHGGIPGYGKHIPVDREGTRIEAGLRRAHTQGGDFQGPGRPAGEGLTLFPKQAHHGLPHRS